MRRDMTPAEAALWSELRGSRLGARFRRQDVIGPYVVDFVCHDRKLIVEVDGQDHYEGIGQYDDGRDRHLNDLGYTVLRFENRDVFAESDWVVDEIKSWL